MKSKYLCGIAFLLAGLLVAAAQGSRYQVEQSWDVTKSISHVSVEFCLLTHGDTQYIAFYDDQWRMTVGSQAIDTNDWKFQAIPSKIEWDSHNYITMAVDRKGHLHVTGNMHGDPLVYFRTETAGDISTLRRKPMVGTEENRVTYPQFVKGGEGRLILNYRNGRSGNGIRYYNVYDEPSQTWSRLLDTPVFDGEGKINAYPMPLVLGPDKFYHTHWVWRHTPDAATNHSLSYARTKDMITWESVFGDPIELPIRIHQKALLVDPVPSQGGIINGGHVLIFGSNDRPLISYHKHDNEGNMQLHVARPETDRWAIHQITDWDKPVPFGGRGSLGFIGIEIESFELLKPGLLTLTYRHKDYGEGRLFLNEETLQPMRTSIQVPPDYPEEVLGVDSAFPRMMTNLFQDIGTPEEAGAHYLLKWETLPRNRDDPWDPPLPEPSTLKLFKMVEVLE